MTNLKEILSQIVKSTTQGESDMTEVTKAGQRATERFFTWANLYTIFGVTPPYETNQTVEESREERKKYLR